MTRISSGYKSYSAAAISELFGARRPLSDSTKAIQKNQESQNEIVNKIEKHIDDVKYGNGDASKDVAYILSKQDSNASSILSQSNPRALTMYSGYLSGLRYDRAARFVNGIEHGLNLLSDVTGKAEKE